VVSLEEPDRSPKFEIAAEGARIVRQVRTRPLADFYVRGDYTGEFRIRVRLEGGQRYVITIKEE
jgi:hypothetical protein